MATTKKTVAPANGKVILNGIGTIKSKADGLYVEGFANKNVVDRANEVIDPTSWDLENYKKNPVILFNHGMDPTLGATPIGKTVAIEPKQDGLYIKAQLAKVDDPAINRIRGLVQEGMLKAFSVGFDAKETDVDAKGVRVIKKAELFEVSIVGVPMNQDSLFVPTGKMLKSKTTNQLVKDILKRKGAWLASAVHDKIYQLQRDEHIDRSATLDEIAKEAGVDMDALTQVLAGNVTPVPEPILAALADKLKMNVDDLKKLDAGDVENEKQTQEDTNEEDDKPGETEPPNEAESQTEQQAEGEGQDAGQGKASDADQSKEEPKDNPKNDGPASEGKLAGDAFRQCVSDKIPKLINEGKEQDQAVAIAINMCQEKGTSCPLTKADYAKIFKATDEYVKTKKWSIDFATKSDAAEKQAGQGEDVPATTTEITTDAPASDFADPMLQSSQQTNVLLGQLIAEVQKLYDMLEKGGAPKPTSSDTTAAAQASTESSDTTSSEAKAGLAPDDSMSTEALHSAQKERAKKYGIEVVDGASLTFPAGYPKDLDMYGDPVNLKYPIDTADHANNARARFKQAADTYKQDSSKKVVHNRIVRRELALGAKPSFDPNDKLDAMLDGDLKDQLKNDAQKAYQARVDSLRKRIENTKQRLKNIEYSP